MFSWLKFMSVLTLNNKLRNQYILSDFIFKNMIIIAYKCALHVRAETHEI
jgi:hypothetical protein